MMSKSSTTTSEKPYRASLKRPSEGWKLRRISTHPGEMLREEFLKPLNLSANALALRMRIPATRLHAILHEKRSVTADTAMRLARCFRTSPEFWMNLQMAHDLTTAQLAAGKTIEREVEPLSPAERAQAA